MKDTFNAQTELVNAMDRFRIILLCYFKMADKKN
jgi:hypothetical protein